MYRRKFLIFMAFVLAAATFCWGDDEGKPKGKPAPSLQSGTKYRLRKTQGDLAASSGAAESAGVSGGYASNADREGDPAVSAFHR